MNIINAPLGKRIMAVFADLFCVFILFLCFYNFAVIPAFDSWTDKKETRETYEGILHEVSLYYYDEKNNTFNTISSKENVSAEDYKVALEAFYDNYIDIKQGEVNHKSWQEIMLEGYEDLEPVYELSDENIVLKSGVTAEEELQFLNKVYNIATSEFSNLKDFRTVSQKLATFTVLELVISFIFGMLIVYLVVPFILKEGRTLGKRITGLSVVSKLGYRISALQLITRALSGIILEFVLGLVTVGISLFVSFTMMIFTKGNTSLHDFLSVTMVIDAKRSTVFINKEEEQKYGREFEVTERKNELSENGNT